MKHLIIILLLASSCFALISGTNPKWALDVSAGNIEGVSAVNKFGRSIDVDAHATDIWDGAIAGDGGDLWVAPTQARTHAISSTSASDDGDPVGVGARTLKIYGLTSWDTKEVSETITLNGTGSVNTVNSYVIIHRMEVVTSGATNINVGAITATAATDGTSTAIIRAGEGQTQMAIYGIPSTVTAYMPCYYVSVVKRAAALATEITLLVNTTPDTELINFLTKHTIGLETEGTSYIKHCFFPFFKITGPAIIKIKAESSTGGTDVSGGFDLILVDN